ncbi:MAG: tRNA pseudouridine(55) synthase TruB [Synergistes sp.]|nr:tRNA pseudouridine(55) synthase TruB [Synergistes sp.]
MSISGILPINKPEGMRSTYCVQKVRGILGKKTKTGHGGTLDSTASGLLLLLIGQATRLSNFVMSMPKCYEAEVTFGTETSTDDASGDITAKADWKHITENVADSALCGFLGWRMQSPPAVSAVHIDGKRAHTLARSGSAIVPDAKPVHFIGISRTSAIDGEGRVNFRINCCKGTYIRSFARDLGRALGSAAHVSKLKRVSCGIFDLNTAKDAEKIFAMTQDDAVAEIVPMTSLWKKFPCFAADGAAFDSLSHGRETSLSSLGKYTVPQSFALNGKIISASEKIFSICTHRKSGGTFLLAPEVNIIMTETNE